ncbi:MAG: endonuclease/exonuclease/phosphatase family protein [Streptosporangiales bacterium]|nr:endonuclease/exonuclease/phosphatase family protein [Streptosporangiales bacterium]
MRVATYNIHHGVGMDGRLDLDRIARVLEREQPDLVGLQEVDRHFSSRSGHVDQGAWLAERLGMAVVFGANLDLDPPAPGRPRRGYGGAVLSRHPVEASAHRLLVHAPGTERRGLVSVRVTVAGRPMAFCTTHLEHTSRALRRLQAEEVLELLASGPASAVVVGDLNATARSAELRALAGSLRDAWPEAGRGDGNTHRSDRPRRRIDYVLHTPDLVAERAYVTGGGGSDHLAVVADLAFPGS